MEKAVVRRGIGAVVLALVAALLLGYLLKGKGNERKEVVNMELPKSPIQIFPEGGNGAAPGGQGAQAGTGAATLVAAGSGAATAVVDGAKKAGKAVVDEGKKAVGADAANKKTVAGNLIVDTETGNPHLDKSKVVVDGAGQAVFGTKSPGAKDTPANFSFRTTASKEVRPSVDGKFTLKKKTAPGGKTNVRLVNEKKLPPVGRSSKSTKIASSRNAKKAVPARKSATTAKTAKKQTPAPAGRNKYVVQLLATSSASKANALKATLKREGYKAYVSKVNRGGKSLYRVRVGSYTGKSGALKKQAAMKRRYLKNPYVQSSIVIKN